MYIYRNNRVKKIVDGMSISQLRESGYFTRHPDAIVCNKPPSTAQLERMAESGTARAIDGCTGIEPDGHCQHGKPSWLLALNYI
jgi:hypothetical protein